MKKELITELNPKSPISEIFRALRTNIQFMNRLGKAQTILFTSTVQAEGKSWVSSNLASTFAQTGKKVIIVDADMRKPRQHKIFSCRMYLGLSNYLSGINELGELETIDYRDCIKKTEIENLYIFPSGNIPPNPSELLLSEKLELLIKNLENEFDVIIFDGAPCLLVTDSTIISRMVDTTILVASSKYTKIDDLKLAKKRIKDVGGKIAGVVLNRVEMSSKKYSDKYYYAETSLSTKDSRRSRNKTSEYRNEIVNKRNEEIRENRRYKYEDIEERNPEKKIREEIDKEKFSTIKEIPSDKAKEILKSINEYK